MNCMLFLAAMFCWHLGDNNAHSPGQRALREARASTPDAQMSVCYCQEHSISNPRPLVLRVRNTGAGSVYYDYYDAANSFDVEVIDARNKPVPLTRYGVAVGRRYAPLQFGVLRYGHGAQLDPGQSYETEFEVQRIFDLSVAGTYRVKVRNRDGFTAEFRPSALSPSPDDAYRAAKRACEFTIEQINIVVVE